MPYVNQMLSGGRDGAVACPLLGPATFPSAIEKRCASAATFWQAPVLGSPLSAAAVLTAFFGACLNFGLVSEASAINCAKASAVEKAICGSQSLREADAALSDLYFA